MNTTRTARPRRLARFLALTLPLLTTAAFAQPAPAATPPAEPGQLKLETFSVTGSRIKRIDAETP
jgi:hypothetical protein